MISEPKICIVADWLTNMGGAEDVVLELHNTFPKAPIYTSTFVKEKMPAFKNLDIRTTYLQKLPYPFNKLHRLFPILRIHAFKKLNLNEFDIIISSSSAESKQVKKTRPDQIHICYCHTPIRYYWSHYDKYKKDPGFGNFNWLIKLLMPILVPKLKKLDFEAAQNIDLFIANSTEVKNRIKKYYNKDSIVIHPPVDINRFTPARKRDDYYVILGRQIPYKKVDLAIKTANKLELPLKVIGNGPEHHNLVEIAGPTIEILANRKTNASDQEVTKILNNAKGYLFPAEEDFGISAVQALASGTPVIAYKKGGSLDIVDLDSGVFFDQQNVNSLAEAIKKFEKRTFLPGTLRRKAKKFDKSLFRTKIKKIVLDYYLNKK